MPKIEPPRIHFGEQRDQVRRCVALACCRVFDGVEELFIREIVNGVLVHYPVVASQFLQRDVDPGREIHTQGSIRDSAEKRDAYTPFLGE